jgi:hypothetical protein
MPNNPASRRAGSTQVVAGNKLVRGAELDTKVAAIGNTPTTDLAAPASSTTTPDMQIPVGVIVMWSGLLAAIPTGWALCDGAAGRPDLRDRFIYGWTAGVDPGGTGGALTHKHSLTAADGAAAVNAAITAGTPTGTLDSVSAGTPSGTNANSSPSLSGSTDAHTTADVAAGAGATVVTGPASHTVTGTVDAHTHTFAGDALAGHTHTFTGSALATHTHTITGSTANNVSGDALPPYFKLAFIIKT